MRNSFFPYLLGLVFCPFLTAQVPYQIPGTTILEDFNALDPEFTNLYGDGHEWIDNETVPGFYANQPNYFSTANPAEPSRFYNLRTGSSSADQSLGSVPGGSAPEISVAWRLVNETGRTLNSFALAYDGQQWRNSGSETASEIRVSYRLGTGDLESGGWQEIPGATFTAIHTGGTAENLAGQLSENSRRVTASVGDGFLWEPGEELWIRWSHASHAGGMNHALAIDNVSVSAGAPFQSIGDRGGWLWSQTGSGHPFGSHAVIGDSGRENELIALLRAWGIGRLYTSGDQIADAPEAVAGWNAKLFHNGIENHLLLSKASWLEPGNWGDLEATLQTNFLDFNAVIPDEIGRFSGIHFDVEPQGLPEWGDLGSEDRRQGLENLLEMLEAARSFLIASGAGDTYVTAAIPHWFDRLPPALGGTGTIGWTSEADRDAWYARLGQAVDGVSLMTFGLGSAASVLDSTERVRATFSGDVFVALRVEGSEWNSSGEMLTVAREIEPFTGGIDIQPLYRFAEFNRWKLRPTYQAWREVSFAEPERSDDSISGPFATPAGDGVTNVLKYALGLGSGMTASNLLPQQELQPADDGGNYPALRFRLLPEAPDLDYAVESTSDLGSEWEQLPAEEIYLLDAVEPGVEEAIGVGAMTTEEISRGFMRLRVDYEVTAFRYRQDFDALDPEFTNLYGDGHPWIDDGTIPGWYASMDHYFATANPIEGRRLYNLRGGSSSTNQTLGSVPSASSGDIQVGTRLLNETGETLRSLTIAYIGEQWRNSGNETASVLTVDYRFGGDGLESGEWVSIPELSFRAIKTGGEGVNLNGKVGSNRHSLRHTVRDIEWVPGEALWIRWTHTNHGGTNHALGIDDVEIEAFPLVGN